MGKKTNNGVTVLDMDKYAPTTWGKPVADTAEPFEYTTASGQLTLIRRLGMTDIFKMGLLDELDFFTKSLAEDDKKPSADTEQAPANFAQQLLKNFDKMETTINKVLVAGVVAPIVHEPVPAPKRSEGKVYADSIPFEDRVELFGEILDTEGLSSFRKESQDGVGDVPADESVQNAAV